MNGDTSIHFNRGVFCGADTDGDSRSGSKERLAEKKMQKPPPTRTITYKVRFCGFFIFDRTVC